MTITKDSVSFGDTINLQPYILNWLVNGENDEYAYREIISQKALPGNKSKFTYKGDLDSFIKNYLDLVRIDHTGEISNTNTYMDYNTNGALTQVYITDTTATATSTDDVVITSIVNYGDLTVSDITTGSDTFYICCFNNSKGSFPLIYISDITDSSITFHDQNSQTATFNINMFDGNDHTIKVKYTYTGSNYISLDDEDYQTLNTFSYLYTSWENFLASVESDYGYIYYGYSSYTADILPYLKSITIDYYNNATITITDTTSAISSTTVDNFTYYSTNTNTVASTEITITGEGTISGIDLFKDRKLYYTDLSKNTILKSLLEYKKRWNINGDSSLLKIDYIGYAGNGNLIIKTTESRV